jgi:hypothetical protein
MGIDVHLSIEITFVNGYASDRVLVAEVVVHHDELGPLMRRRWAATIDELIDVTEEFPKHRWSRSSAAGARVPRIRGLRRAGRELIAITIHQHLSMELA